MKQFIDNCQKLRQQLQYQEGNDITRYNELALEMFSQINDKYGLEFDIKNVLIKSNNKSTIILFADKGNTWDNSIHFTIRNNTTSTSLSVKTNYARDTYKTNSFNIMKLNHLYMTNDDVKQDIQMIINKYNDLYSIRNKIEALEFLLEYAGVVESKLAVEEAVYSGLVESTGRYVNCFDGSSKYATKMTIIKNDTGTYNVDVWNGDDIISSSKRANEEVVMKMAKDLLLK